MNHRLLGYRDGNVDVSLDSVDDFFGNRYHVVDGDLDFNVFFNDVVHRYGVRFQDLPEATTHATS